MTFDNPKTLILNPFLFFSYHFLSHIELRDKEKATAFKKELKIKDVVQPIPKKR